MFQDEDPLNQAILTRLLAGISTRKYARTVEGGAADTACASFWHATRTDAPYVCIEPWSSLPARKDVVEDLARQPDLQRAEPGGTYRNVWTVDIR